MTINKYKVGDLCQWHYGGPVPPFIGYFVLVCLKKGTYVSQPVWTYINMTTGKVEVDSESLLNLYAVNITHLMRTGDEDNLMRKEKQ